MLNYKNYTYAFLQKITNNSICLYIVSHTTISRNNLILCFFFEFQLDPIVPAIFTSNIIFGNYCCVSLSMQFSYKCTIIECSRVHTTLYTTKPLKLYY